MSAKKLKAIPHNAADVLCGVALKERAYDLAVYIIENQTTVRAAAKQFGVSKSTVHMDKTIWNGSSGRWLKR